MPLYDFLFDYPPSPRTIKRIRETIERAELKIKRERNMGHGVNMGYVAALDDLVAALKKLEDDLGYEIMEETPYKL